MIYMCLNVFQATKERRDYTNGHDSTKITLDSIVPMIISPVFIWVSVCFCLTWWDISSVCPPGHAAAACCCGLIGGESVWAHGYKHMTRHAESRRDLGISGRSAQPSFNPWTVASCFYVYVLFYPWRSFDSPFLTWISEKMWWLVNMDINQSHQHVA